MGGRIYHCIGKRIFKYQNNQYALWKDFTGTAYVGRLWGRSELDFFTGGNKGLMHYNGTDLVTLFPMSGDFTDVAVFQKDIFVLCDSRIIVHGSLR
jgi:hypothetical protein